LSWGALELQRYGTKYLVSKKTPACSVSVIRLELTLKEMLTLPYWLWVTFQINSVLRPCLARFYFLKFSDEFALALAKELQKGLELQ
jgi:hypothetical protein